MSRRNRAEVRKVVADPVYNSTVVTKVINQVMIDGKRSIAQKVVYDAMEQGLITAYKKNYDSKTNVKIDINRETGEFKVIRYFVVVDDYIEGDGVCFIEWANLIDDLLPEERTEITIEKDLSKGFDYRLISRKEIQ